MPPFELLAKQFETLSNSELASDAPARAILEQWFMIFSTQLVAEILPTNNTYYRRAPQLQKLFARADFNGTPSLLEPLSQQVARSLKIESYDLVRLEKALLTAFEADDLDLWNVVDDTITNGLVSCARYKISTDFADSLGSATTHYPLAEADFLDSLRDNPARDVREEVEEFGMHCQNLMENIINAQDPFVRERVLHLLEHFEDASIAESIFLTVGAFIAIVSLEKAHKYIGLSLIELSRKVSANYDQSMQLLDLLYTRNDIKVLEPLLLENFVAVLVATMDCLYNVEKYPRLAEILGKICARLKTSKAGLLESVEASFWIEALKSPTTRQAPSPTVARSAPRVVYAPGDSPIYKLGQKEQRRREYSKSIVQPDVPRKKNEKTINLITAAVAGEAQIQQLQSVCERSIWVGADWQLARVTVESLMQENPVSRAIKAAYQINPEFVTERHSTFIKIERSDNISQFEVHDGDYRIYIYKFAGKHIFTRMKHGHNTSENWKWDELRLQQIIEAFEQLEA
jgi:NADPH-dependent 7-cyano-7-deazaguanine reductase QueF-like protein